MTPLGAPVRVGIGFDIHPLVAGRPLMLGGVVVPFHKGLQGHSDGDALIHAAVDAILGALGLGDIGRHFPDADPANRGRASREFLEAAAALVRDRGLEIHHLDATILAELPKLAPHMAAMELALAQALSVPPDRINVKATTMERLGPIGEGLAIAAQAVVAIGPPIGP